MLEWMGTFFGVGDAAAFNGHVRGMRASLSPGHDNGFFASDNLVTITRNLSFLTDRTFMTAIAAHAKSQTEQGIIWRLATLVWAADNAKRLEGDLVECGCYRGTSARIIADTTKLAETRRYFLYDLFEHDASMPHHPMPEHGATLYDEVKNRFADLPNVIITKGKVPDSLKTAPDKIAFMHLDLNNAEAEIGALNALFERMVPGAILILDDYGWLAYRKQKLAEDPWFAARGYRVLELPTGQGMVIK